jgi:hypothetical protein
MSQFHYSDPTKTNNNFSPQTILMQDGKYISTNYVYASPTVQRQANVIYEYKKAYEITTNAAQTGLTFRFASEQDRLLAKIGLFAATQARR